MATDRIDKSWQKNGLEEYSLEAILGTLSHYGVTVDETRFKAMAADTFPLFIAQEWHEDWKGVGQFAKLPYSAANELWRRFVPDRLRPIDFADALGDLLVALQDLVGEAPNEEVAPANEKVQALRAKLPKDEEKLADYMEEVFLQFDEQGSEVFDELAEELAKAGRLDEARAFVELEEALFPDRRGIASAVMRAATGERDQAVAELEQLTQDAARSQDSRLLAIDGLIHLDAHEPALKHGNKMLDDAEKAEDWHLALAAADRLAFLLEKLERNEELDALADRAEKLSEAHDRAHPDHAHHH